MKLGAARRIALPSRPGGAAAAGPARVINSETSPGQCRTSSPLPATAPLSHRQRRGGDIPRRYLPRRYIPRRYIYGIYTSTVYTSTVSYLDGRRHTQRCRSKLRGRDAAVGKPRSADRPTATRTALCSCGGWWQRAGERACRLRTAAVSAAPASCRALHRLQPAARPRRQPAQQQHGGRLAPAAGILQADCGYVSMSRRHGSELQSGRGCAAVSQPAVSLQLQQGFMVWWRRWRRCCCWW